MLKQILGLPEQVIGVKAEGRVTRNDYEQVLDPLLEKAHQEGSRIRFLYQLDFDFSGFTAGAALEDFKIGIKYLRLFEKCAIVTDVKWIRQSVHLMEPLVPCPVKAFSIAEFEAAKNWLLASDSKSKLEFDLRSDGILVVRPQGAIQREDFDRLASVVDPWIEGHHELKGIVVCMKKFSGWDNFGSFIRHLEFIQAHHKKVQKVAVATDGILPEAMAKVASHFAKAQIKQFPYEKSDEAVKWAS